MWALYELGAGPDSNDRLLVAFSEPLPAERVKQHMVDIAVRGLVIYDGRFIHVDRLFVRHLSLYEERLLSVPRQ